MQQLKILLILFVAFACFETVIAQPLDTDPKMDDPKDGSRKPNHPKKTLQDEDGKIYWQLSLPVYVNITSSEEGKGESYRMTEVTSPTMEKFANPMYFDGHGTHYIRHKDYMAGIPEQEVSFPVYVDGLAPTTKILYNDAPKYTSNEVTFYGKGLAATLSSKDQMAGLEQILFATNGSSFGLYKDEIKFGEERTYKFEYYAVDRVGNDEKVHVEAFTVDHTAPKTDYNLQGTRLDMIFSSKVNIDLFAKDNGAGVKRIDWKVDEAPEAILRGKINVAYLKDGDHVLTYRATDRVANEEEVQTLKFYLDKIAPVVTAEIKGDVYRAKGKAYVSERSMISLSATDNKAGVKTIFFTQDGRPFTEYAEPFQLKGGQGAHYVKFKGQDKVDNIGALKSDDDLANLMLDLSAPKINHAYVGPQFKTRDTTFITSETKVRLTATDYQSGVQTLNYKLDGEEEEFKEPFTVEKDGYHKVDYFAKDNVNNLAENDFFLVVDNDGPEIYHHFSMQNVGMAKMDEEGEVPVYSTHNLLYLAATDEAVGTNKIFYTMDENTERLYAGPIKGISKGFHTLKIRAVDYLGNETTSDIINFMIK